MYQVSPWKLNPRLSLRGQFSMGCFIQMLSAPAMERLSACALLREMPPVHLLAESMARFIGGGFTSWHFGLLRHRGVNTWVPNYILAQKAKPSSGVVEAPISTHSHFKASVSTLVRAMKYSARLIIIPPSILGISSERR